MGGSNKAIIPVRFHLTPAEGAFAVLGGFGPRTPGSPSPLQGSDEQESEQDGFGWTVVYGISKVLMFAVCLSDSHWL